MTFSAPIGVVATFRSEKPMAAPGGHCNAAVDEVLVQAERLAPVDVWSVARVATELREHVHDEVLRHRARIRVSWALAERPSAVDERAAAILDEALRLACFADQDVDHVATCGWPYDTPCPRCYPLLANGPQDALSLD
jgi:hypothetical protein